MTLIKNRRLSLLLACLSLSTLWGDQIVLKDGDRITGSIVKKDGQTVTILSKNFGSVTLKWDDIATVKTDQPLNVGVPGGQTVKATIEMQDGRIQVAGPGAPRRNALPPSRPASPASPPRGCRSNSRQRARRS